MLTPRTKLTLATVLMALALLLAAAAPAQASPSAPKTFCWWGNVRLGADAAPAFGIPRHCRTYLPLVAAATAKAEVQPQASAEEEGYWDSMALNPACWLVVRIVAEAGQPWTAIEVTWDGDLWLSPADWWPDFDGRFQTYGRGLVVRSAQPVHLELLGDAPRCPTYLPTTLGGAR